MEQNIVKETNFVGTCPMKAKALIYLIPMVHHF